ncbi:hypothetical protein APY94_07250 [Thermococcus celericrescens]|uniref:Uncharacterized protein n=2 Tax=Thermococcus celericrescens TaxID=227598 RepID=A0A100XXF8_9EURY|nr:hypothetical protein APY94_07250 [Thermococcus celericrescens]
MEETPRLNVGFLILGSMVGVASAAKPETKANGSDPYYRYGHFVGKVGIASTYIPRLAVINQDDTATLQQAFFLRVKLGNGWKSGWNHYYYPVSSGHWISVKVIKPSSETYVGIVSGRNGIFVVDTGQGHSNLEDKYFEFFKKAVDKLAELLKLPGFADLVSSLGKSDRDSYTIQTSGDIFYQDISRITVRFYWDSRFRGTDYCMGVTWIITNPREGDYKFEVSGGATLYVAGYSHNSIPSFPEAKSVGPTSVLGKTTRIARVTVKTRVYYAGGG